MKKWIAFVLIGLLMCGMIPMAFAEQTPYQLGDHVDDFTVTLADGTATSLYGLLAEKKAVLINFWASWCTPCKMEFPALQEAYDQMSDEIGVIALDIEPTDTNETVLKVKEDIGLTSLPMGLDVGQAKRFGVAAYPTSVMIDRNGVVCFIGSSSIPNADKFLRLFSAFTADDYSEPVLLTEIPAETPTVETPTVEVLSNALNLQGDNLTVVPNSDPSVWPFVPCADGNGIEASNPEVHDTTAALRATVTVGEGEALVFEYINASDNFGNFIVYVDEQPVAVYDGSEDWTLDCVGFRTAGEHSVAFVFRVSNQTNTATSLKLRNLRVLSAEEAAPLLAAHPILPAKNSAEVGNTMDIVQGDLKPVDLVVTKDGADEVAMTLNLLTSDTLKLRINLRENENDTLMFYTAAGSYYPIRKLSRDAEAYQYEYKKGEGDGLPVLARNFSLYPDFVNTTAAPIFSLTWCDTEQEIDSLIEYIVQMAEANGVKYDEVFWRYSDGSEKQGESGETATAIVADYQIAVTDAEGRGIEGVMVQICDADTCQVATTDADGMVSLTMTPYPYEIHILMVPEGYVRPAEASTMPVDGGNLVFTLEKQ